ncbi:MAG: family transcriptional regulator, cyclic receptor protein [Solirubrobacteraceae bacterium]|jgi:CRP-like cAMP-binding protein|nr:family transcriptional regulator, cyclic receptor protein [Solirubrobacteraceae bacterium]MEA2243648.1 family transcriptional regulator, cyclic receptor protein [Solirubrobacteraceae bacterium]
MFCLQSRPIGMEMLRLAALTHLRSLDHEQLAQIAPHACERVIPAGRRLLLDGPFAQELMLIAAGRGVVRCAGEAIAELGAGDVFGELGQVRPAYATATVTAITDLHVVVISERAMRLLHEAAPDAVAGLLGACAVAPLGRAGAQAGLRPASHLSLVRSAAA